MHNKLVVAFVTEACFIVFAGRGDVVRVGKDVEEFVVGVESKHGTVVGNHFVEACLFGILIIRRKLVFGSELHRAVFVELTEQVVTLLISVGKIEHFPAVFGAAERFVIVGHSLFDAIGSRLVEEVVYFVLTRREHGETRGNGCYKKYLFIHCYSLFI